MGRPLNKRYFGNPDLPGKQLVLNSAWLADAEEAASGFWVVRQVGTGRFQVTNGETVGVVRIVGYAPLKAGEATILVTPFGSDDAEHARVIYNRTVTTWEGGNYKWTREEATEEGEATLPWESTESEYTEEQALEDINGATDGVEIVAIIEAHPELFMSEEDLVVFEELEPTSRQAAVGAGVAEWIALFGPFEDIELLRQTVSLHTTTEAHKQAFIKTVDAAVDADALKAAFETTLPVVVEDRLALISDLRASGVAPAMDRADELEAEDFTVILGNFADELPTLETETFEFILAERNALSNGKFFGTARMLPVLNEALALGEE